MNSTSRKDILLSRKLSTPPNIIFNNFLAPRILVHPLTAAKQVFLRHQEYIRRRQLRLSRLRFMYQNLVAISIMNIHCTKNKLGLGSYTSLGFVLCSKILVTITINEYLRYHDIQILAVQSLFRGTMTFRY